MKNLCFSIKNKLHLHLHNSPKNKIPKRNGVTYVIAASILSFAGFLVAHPLFLDGHRVTPYMRQEQSLTIHPKQQQQQQPYTKEELYQTDTPFQISRTNNLIYVHVPKTGGTTFENSILFHDARAHHMVGGHHPISKMLDHAPQRGLTSVTSSPKTKFIKVAHVRHPCERFISAFEYLKRGGMNAGDAQRAVDYNIDTMSMEEFVLEIKDRAWFNGAPVHFIPQVDYLFYKSGTGVFGGRSYAKDMPHGTFGLDMVLCQDDWMEGLHRLNMEMMKRNNGGVGVDVGGDRNTQDQQQQYLPEDLYTTKQNYSTKQEKMTCKDLNVETRGRIEQIYAMDYCVFGYKTLLSEEDVCVGSYMTAEQFTEKFRECEERIGGDVMLKPWL